MQPVILIRLGAEVHRDNSGRGLSNRSYYNPRVMKDSGLCNGYSNAIKEASLLMAKVRICIKKCRYCVTRIITVHGERTVHLNNHKSYVSMM
jgi:predicted DNA-binding helix-hairpin-helix protein